MIFRGMRVISVTFLNLKKSLSFILFHIICIVLFVLTMSVKCFLPRYMSATVCPFRKLRSTATVIRMGLCGHTLVRSLKRCKTAAATQYHSPSYHACLLYTDHKCQQQNRNQRPLWYKTVRKVALLQASLLFQYVECLHWTFRGLGFSVDVDIFVLLFVDEIQIQSIYCWFLSLMFLLPLQHFKLGCYICFIKKKKKKGEKLLLCSRWVYQCNIQKQKKCIKLVYNVNDLQAHNSKWISRIQ